MQVNTAIMSQNKRHVFTKAVEDIATLYKVAPSTLKGKMDALDSVIPILVACKDPISNHVALEKISRKLKDHALTTCRKHTALQSAILKAYGGIHEIKRIYLTLDLSQKQDCIECIEKACSELEAEKRHVTRSMRNKEVEHTSRSERVGFFTEQQEKQDETLIPPAGATIHAAPIIG